MANSLSPHLTWAPEGIRTRIVVMMYVLQIVFFPDLTMTMKSKKVKRPDVEFDDDTDDSDDEALEVFR
jgi:hypothetical protein